MRTSLADRKFEICTLYTEVDSSTDKNRIQVFMLLHAFGNHIYKLIGAWLVIAKRR